MISFKTKSKRFPLYFYSIKWRKDGREYLTLPGKSSTTEIRELDRVTSKLRIGDADNGDAGRYSCEAVNAFGKSHFSIDVTIWGEKILFIKKNKNNYGSLQIYSILAF